MAALDYSTFADGRVIFWEANPFFALPPWSLGVLAEARRLDERVPRYPELMVSDLIQLADDSND